MFDVGGGELIFIILVILLLFGPKKIPEFAQMLGKGMRQFRKAQEDLTQQIRNISADAALNELDKPYTPPAPAQETFARTTPNVEQPPPPQSPA